MLLLLNRINIKSSVKVILKLIIAEHRQYEKEEFKWLVLNDYVGMILEPLGFKNIKKYSEMVQKINGTVETDNRTSEEIINDVLSLFKEKGEE
ncbi:MAG: hypothetical protein ACRDDY_02530 [Clostridium sp.]|uniref:hypothetical protein n=1 Tax=Clostridium sp. TaxID=1506 RepID=UPI003EE484D7